MPISPSLKDKTIAPQSEHGVQFYSPDQTIALQEENETTSESEYESSNESGGSQLISDSEDDFKPSAAAERFAEMHGLQSIDARLCAGHQSIHQRAFILW